jgi:hypothetical protein
MEGLGIEGASFGLVEVFVALPFDVGKLNLDALAFEGNALGFVGLTLEAGDAGAEVTEAAFAGFGVGVFGVEGADGDGGVVEGEPAGEFVGEGAGQRVVAEGFFVFEVMGQGEGVVAGEPVAVAAVFPLGEVGRGEGLGGELGGEDGLDLGEGIEPVEEGGAGLVVEEAAVELVANGGGEAGDFSGASHGVKGVRGLVDWWIGGLVDHGVKGRPWEAWDGWALWAGRRGDGRRARAGRAISDCITFIATVFACSVGRVQMLHWLYWLYWFFYAFCAFSPMFHSGLV